MDKFSSIKENCFSSSRSVVRALVCVRPSHLPSPVKPRHGVHLHLSGHQFCKRLANSPYVRDRITDPEEFKKYEESAGAASAGQPVTPLAFYGAIETLEGASVDGAVILQFPTMADAKAAYDSPLYQKALKHRLKGAEYRVFIVEGLAGTTGSAT